MLLGGALIAYSIMQMYAACKFLNVRSIHMICRHRPHVSQSWEHESKCFSAKEIIHRVVALTLVLLNC